MGGKGARVRVREVKKVGKEIDKNGREGKEKKGRVRERKKVM